jgi:hypothetical protein
MIRLGGGHPTPYIRGLPPLVFGRRSTATQGRRSPNNEQVRRRSRADTKTAKRPTVTINQPGPCTPPAECRRQIRPFYTMRSACFLLSGRTIAPCAALLPSPGISTRWRCLAPIVSLARCWVIQDISPGGLSVFGAIQGSRSFQRHSKHGNLLSPSSARRTFIPGCLPLPGELFLIFCIVYRCSCCVISDILCISLSQNDYRG